MRITICYFPLISILFFLLLLFMFRFGRHTNFTNRNVYNFWTIHSRVCVWRTEQGYFSRICLAMGMGIYFSIDRHDDYSLGHQYTEQGKYRTETLDSWLCLCVYVNCDVGIPRAGAKTDQSIYCRCTFKLIYSLP